MALNEETQGELTAFLTHVASLMQNYLERCFSPVRHPQPLFQAMRYSLLSGGKRLRPALCLASATAVGVHEMEALPAAAAIEMIHTYSLIHDDLPMMDDDDLRHGRPSNHKVYGEAMALLAGDGLLTEAISHLASSSQALRRLEMLQVLSHAAGAYGMVGGQAADMLAENGGGSETDLSFIHRHKTGKLIMASVVIGALHEKTGPKELNLFTKFGRCLGELYQMVDDVLDITATTEQLGKTSGKDAHQHKLTYPGLIGLDATKRRIQEKQDEALTALADLRYDTAMLASICRYVVDRDH